MDFEDIIQRALIDLREFLEENPELAPLQEEVNRRMFMAGEGSLDRLYVVAEMMEWIMCSTPVEEFQDIGKKWGNVVKNLEKLSEANANYQFLEKKVQ